MSIQYQADLGKFTYRVRVDDKTEGEQVSIDMLVGERWSPSLRHPFQKGPRWDPPFVYYPLDLAGPDEPIIEHIPQIPEKGSMIWLSGPQLLKLLEPAREHYRNL